VATGLARLPIEGDATGRGEEADMADNSHNRGCVGKEESRFRMELALDREGEVMDSNLVAGNVETRSHMVVAGPGTSDTHCAFPFGDNGICAHSTNSLFPQSALSQCLAHVHWMLLT
jgi:hypothetical protein